MNFHDLQWMTRKLSEYFFLQKESNVRFEQHEREKKSEPPRQIDFTYIFKAKSKTGNYQ